MQKISERGKNRLRIAARFLRREGYLFEGSNFYGLVIDCIFKLDSATNGHLRELVDWIETYENTEKEIYGEITRSRAKKPKTKFSSRRALRTGVSDAESESANFNKNSLIEYQHE